MPHILLEMFPKEAYTGYWMVVFRLVIPLFMVMALSQFIAYLLILIVGEKENKIDQIKENQDYIPGSLKIFESVTQADGKVIKLDDLAVNDKMSLIQEPSETNNQTLEIHFPSQSQHTYLIEFETSVEGKVVEKSENYTNVAEYSNDGNSREITGKVSVKNGGSHMQKTGEQDSADSDYVYWNLVINPAQSTLNKVKVTDRSLLKFYSKSFNFARIY